MAKAKEAQVETVEEAIRIPKINVQTAKLQLLGDSPLIMNRFSDESKTKMRDAQGKKAVGARPAKDPQKCYEGSIYHHPDGGYAMPAIAFKKAAISACRHTQGIPMTLARGMFHVSGEWVKIEGIPMMREDVVKNATGVADLRYRAEFKTWSCELMIRYNADSVSLEQIVNLFSLAGFHVGIGDGRPEKSGMNYGLFHIE